MDLVIALLHGPPPGQRPVEVVERKGVGHPDTICDGVAEHISARLCRYYRDRFGAILHHNVDKVLLCGGRSRVEFGGGEVLDPIEIYLAGRATAEHHGEHIPIHDLAIEACRDWLTQHLHALDVKKHVRITSRLRPGSSELVALFDQAELGALANDTSCGAGFAPLTDLERVVLAVERGLNSAATKRARPEIGEDIKVMGVRRGSRIHLTIGCALIARFVADLDDYRTKIDAVARLAIDAAGRSTTLEVDVTVNAADNLARGNVFLTVTGTSGESGDDGEVGRGNRTSGLITPYRAMTLEAAAGKNPVSHVGKLYNLAAGRIAARVAEMAGVTDASCVMVSQIGRLVRDPRVVDIGVMGLPELDGRARSSIEAIVDAELAGIPLLRDQLLAEGIAVY